MSDEEAERLLSGSKKIPETTSGRVVDEQSNGDASSASPQSVPVMPNSPAFGDTINALKQNPGMLK